MARAICVWSRHPPPHHLAKGPPLKPTQKPIIKPTRKHLPVLATLSLVGLIGLPTVSAEAQSREQRVDQITSALAGAVSTRPTPPPREQRATPRQLIRETLTAVDFEAMPAKLALEIWASQTQIPLVMNWKALELAGVDPTAPVSLKLDKVPADIVLKLIVGQMQPANGLEDDRLLVDVEQWFVRVMTKRDALRRSSTKLYFIGDLLMDIPQFTNAPGFDLNEALSNTNSGGSNGGGGGGQGSGLFDTNDTAEEEVTLTKAEKADRVMDLLRNAIEPDIWRANGGEYASMRYMRGMLVVKAPDFVHEQIGVPFTGNTPRPAARTNPNRSSSNQDNARPSRYDGGNVAGKGSREPKTMR